MERDRHLPAGKRSISKMVDLEIDPPDLRQIPQS
jgi:hypothetical protein